jgi:hypothetical protein
MRPWKSILAALAVTGMSSFTTPAYANKAEASDLRRQIDSQRSAVADLERLDDTHKTTAETTLLRSWLDEADAQHAKEKWDDVRLTLDRCIAQAELIRQKTIAAKLGQRADERERAATASKEKLEATKKALADAQTNKKAMEMNSK